MYSTSTLFYTTITILVSIEAHIVNLTQFKLLGSTACRFLHDVGILHINISDRKIHWGVTKYDSQTLGFDNEVTMTRPPEKRGVTRSIVW